MLKNTVLLLFLVSPAFAQETPPEPPAALPPVVFPPDYVKPAKLDGVFWRVHRFDLERIVDDRNALKTCRSTLKTCEKYRLEDVTNPPDGLAVNWWQATVAGVITITATLLAKKGVEKL